MTPQPVEPVKPSGPGGTASRDLPSRQELIKRFSQLIDRVSAGVGPSMLEAHSELELTIDQFRALALLRAGPQRITDIANALGMRLSAASTFLDRLEARRLITRFHDQKDHRVVRCRLTALGAEQAHSLWRLDGQRVEHLATILARDDMERVLEVLTLLATTAEQDSPVSGAGAVQPQLSFELGGASNKPPDEHALDTPPGIISATGANTASNKPPDEHALDSPG